ncbi:SRPBCC domain-containing protein [Nonomuraea africana]|uniref:Uncharacterized protein YndB with AHSA1/START domain n=1 Tax=Nonomuraea africana TaxID=46171 RepID=A0ABR9KNS3_9ACTN|nr:SRPBCC domain-containing protein [Nonomuraea africana]MBE1563674.1 uncharacterized protein YndB with AHSA1/START domain [Nonomuraea africana]
MTEPMILRVRVAAPAKEVWHALTDPAALRTWLAEHAEVDLPGRFEFWGRFTPDGEAPHQRVLHVGEHTLRLEWTLGGVATTSEISLEEEGPESTIVSLEQSHFDFQDVITGASVRGNLQTFWCLSLANLTDHVEGRPLTPKVDYTSATMREEVLIDAPMAEVYDSLVDSEKATRWFGYKIEIEPRVGGRWAMGGFENPDPAKVIDLDEGRAMTVDWGPVGLTSWELAESEGKTKLTFVQSGFDEARPPHAGWAGWLSGLAELRRFHELPDWKPIWVEAS